MKFVVLGPVHPYRGGIAHYTTMLAEALRVHHEVQVLSFRRQYPAWLYPGRSDKDPSQHPLQIPTTYMLDSLNPFTWWKAGNWIRRQKPDLLILQWWITFLSPAYRVVTSLSRKAGIPVLYIIHNVLPHEGSIIHLPLARLALKQGNYFIVHADEQRQRLLNLLPTANVHVFPFPIYDRLAANSRLPDRDEARKVLGLPLDESILLFFGIVRPYKGLMTLVEALVYLRAQGVKAQLVVAGEFWEDKKPYLKAIERLNLTNWVHLEDRYIPDEEIGVYFAASDVAVAPYVDGTQSAVVSLAHAFGVPVVMTEKSAAGVDPDLLDPTCVVPSADPVALANAVRQQLDHPRPLPLQRGSWQKLVEKIVSLVLGEASR